MPHLDDIWYVGRARAEGAHGDLDGGQRSSEVKWVKLCAMATIFGQKKPWCNLRMMMTLMEVKGHQRSNEVNYVLWLPYLVKEALMQAENHDDLDGGQRSSEVKWGKLCAMATIFGQKKCWCKLRIMMTLMEVKGHQRSNGVNYCAMATIFGQKKPWCKLRMMMTLMEVKGHQRSNGVSYVLWQPYLVKRSTDASWEWWWPWWRSKVIRSQMG